MRRSIAVLVSVAAVAALPATAGASDRPPTVDEIIEKVNPCGPTALCQGPEWPSTRASLSNKYVDAIIELVNPCGDDANCQGPEWPAL